MGLNVAILLMPVVTKGLTVSPRLDLTKPALVNSEVFRYSSTHWTVIVCLVCVVLCCSFNFAMIFLAVGSHYLYVKIVLLGWYSLWDDIFCGVMLHPYETVLKLRTGFRIFGDTTRHERLQNQDVRVLINTPDTGSSSG